MLINTPSQGIWPLSIWALITDVSLSPVVELLEASDSGGNVVLRLLEVFPTSDSAAVAARLSRDQASVWCAIRLRHGPTSCSFDLLDLSLYTKPSGRYTENATL